MYLVQKYAKKQLDKDNPDKLGLILMTVLCLIAIMRHKEVYMSEENQNNNEQELKKQIEELTARAEKAEKERDELNAFAQKQQEKIDAKNAEQQGESNVSNEQSTAKDGENPGLDRKADEDQGKQGSKFYDSMTGPTANKVYSTVCAGGACFAGYVVVTNFSWLAVAAGVACLDS